MISSIKVFIIVAIRSEKKVKNKRETKESTLRDISIEINR